ncbi:MAG: 3-dehydroquinate synthase [Bacteroidota bacterium]
MLSKKNPIQKSIEKNHSFIIQLNESGIICPVYYGDHSLKWLQQRFNKTNSKSGCFILVDENTRKHCLPLLLPQIRCFENSIIIEIPQGEEYKDIEYCQQIWEMLLEEGANRNSVIINLGGGVLCDLGGFAASVYKRGIPFIHIPTTLLAMTDAAIGGKTAVNSGHLKNVIGNFSFPEAVLIMPEFLNSLPESHYQSGFAEVIKHATIGDPLLWKKLLKQEIHLSSEEMITHSIALKTKIVNEDPLEHGKRRILNFGHTIGHALESFFAKKGKRISHGEAVAAGMVCECMLSHTFCKLSMQESDEIICFIQKHFSLPQFKKDDISGICSYIRNDKKNTEADTAGFSLLSKIGKCEFNCQVSYKKIEESLLAYLQKNKAE